MSRELGGERYVKRFDGWHHLLTMLYAVIMRFDSLREIEASMLAEVRKLSHLGLEAVPRRSTLSDATTITITLFSNLIFKGAGRHPKTGKKKGGIKVHTVIYANEGVPCDVRFTSAATNDSFMLAPANYNHGAIVAMDRAYVNSHRESRAAGENEMLTTRSSGG